MGLCVDGDENLSGLDFEIRRDSVRFYLGDGDPVEILKTDLTKIKILLQDPQWSDKVVGCTSPSAVPAN